VSLASTTALLVATLDLQLTHSVISAIRKADAESGQGVLRRHVEPEPVIEPRDRFHPQSQQIANPVVLRPQARILPRIVDKPTGAAPTVDPAIPAPVAHHTSGIEAPWKKLPYPDKIYAHPKIKHPSYQSDTPHKGTMIDFFC
jgi:hypothetical protein